MKFDLTDILAKTARILSEEDQVNPNAELQAIVGDPDDTRISTFTQFKPNPGNMQLPDQNSPLQGDDVFFAYLIPGAVFQDKNGKEWWVESYGSPDQIEITNRWYPRVGGIVGIADIRRSIHAWLEPIYQVVPPPPPGVTYGALPVRVVNDEAGERVTEDSLASINTNSGW